MCRVSQHSFQSKHERKFTFSVIVTKSTRAISSDLPFFWCDFLFADNARINCVYIRVAWQTRVWRSLSLSAMNENSINLSKISNLCVDKKLFAVGNEVGMILKQIYCSHDNGGKSDFSIFRFSQTVMMFLTFINHGFRTVSEVFNLIKLPAQASQINLFNTPAEN